MIRLLEYTNVLSIKTQEYSCPECCKPQQWCPNNQMSPAVCLGCRAPMMDITKIIDNIEWRTTYHYLGENFVKCGLLAPTQTQISAAMSGRP